MTSRAIARALDIVNQTGLRAPWGEVDHALAHRKDGSAEKQQANASHPARQALRRTLPDHATPHVQIRYLA